MSAKILAFDPNRKVRPRHYTPIAMRGRLLRMPSRTAEANSAITWTEESSRSAVTPNLPGLRLDGSRTWYSWVASLRSAGPGSFPVQNHAGDHDQIPADDYDVNYIDDPKALAHPHRDRYGDELTHEDAAKAAK